MDDILFQYESVHAATWVYLSSLLTIALYFKFGRLWSVRNFDLLALILLAPGLVMVLAPVNDSHSVTPDRVQFLGFAWLFVANGVLLLRLLIDPLMVRRPLLEPNLSVGGQTFLCAALIVFLMANVVTRDVVPEDLAVPRRAEQLGSFQADTPSLDEEGNPKPGTSLATHGPGYPLIFLFPTFSTQALFDASISGSAAVPVSRQSEQEEVYARTAKVMAILSHLAIVVGIVVIGYRHFENIKAGIAAASLYLLVPYTALFTGRVTHFLPAALLVWAIVAYRRPLLSGMLIGMAAGAAYYPAFVLPLWIAFYWQRGLLRFLTGFLVMVLVLVASLSLTSADLDQFWDQFFQMFGLRMPAMDGLGGLWLYLQPVYRLPTLAAFLAMIISFAIWPAQKNLGTLISCSAAVMVGTQFWRATDGGLYLAWFLPLLLLTIFRPNLEDRVALQVIGEGWQFGRKGNGRPKQAA